MVDSSDLKRDCQTQCAERKGVTNMLKKSAKLLSLHELEALTGRKVSTWRRAIAEKRIPFVRLGRSIRVPQEVIDQMIEVGWNDPVEKK